MKFLGLLIPLELRTFIPVMPRLLALKTYDFVVSCFLLTRSRFKSTFGVSWSIAESSALPMLPQTVDPSRDQRQLILFRSFAIFRAVTIGLHFAGRLLMIFLT